MSQRGRVIDTYTPIIYVLYVCRKKPYSFITGWWFRTFAGGPTPYVWQTCCVFFKQVTDCGVSWITYNKDIKIENMGKLTLRNAVVFLAGKYWISINAIWLWKWLINSSHVCRFQNRKSGQVKFGPDNGYCRGCLKRSIIYLWLLVVNRKGRCECEYFLFHFSSKFEQ